MKHFLNIFLCVLFSFSVYSQQKNDERIEALEKDIEFLIEQYDAVGLAVAVVKGDNIIYSNGFGLRDREAQLEMTAETLLPIGSSSKAFTSILAGILESEGKLSLEDRPSDYLPGLKFYNDEMDRLISIEDLLSHKSGLGGLDGSNAFFPTKNPIDFIPRFEHLKPNGAIKNSFIYSNAGFGLAGLVIQEVSGKTWDEYLKDKIFSPLKMNRSNSSMAEMKQDKNHAIGYGLSEGEQVKLLNRYFNFGKPEGAVISTVNEMGNYLIAWLNEGKFQEQQIIPENYIAKASSAQNILTENKAGEDFRMRGYGYGWFIDYKEGHYKVHHGGNVPGYSTQVAMYPNDNIGIVVISNQNNSALPYLVEDVISNRLLNLEQKELKEYDVNIAEIWNKVRPVNTHNETQKVTHALKAYCGTYYNAGHGAVSISEKNDYLYIQFPAHKFILEHQNYNNFIMLNTEEVPETFGVSHFPLFFQINFDGAIESLSLWIQSDPVVFERQEK